MKIELILYLSRKVRDIKYQLIILPIYKCHQGGMYTKVGEVKVGGYHLVSGFYNLPWKVFIC